MIMQEDIQHLDSLAVGRIQQAFLTKVYGWMCVGLLITGAAAWYTFDSGLWYDIAVNRMFFWGIIIAELVLVWTLSSKVATLSTVLSGALFIGYSALNGLTFSVILAAYTLESIAEVFFLTAGMFLALSVFGFVTKKNLSGLGSFMFMGLIGIIGLTIMNFFIHSSAVYFAVSIAGVLVFAGLTAYDTQKLKEMSVIELKGGEAAAKTAIVGALSLYLDFINLFLFLIQLLGNRR